MKSAVQDPFAKGRRIDRYEIGDLIGQGGMGAVYRAFDTKLGRTVALKTVIAERRGERLTEEVRQRFLREALAISKVEHRNVVQVLDFGFAENGTPFLVMEFLRGRDLGSILNDNVGPLPVEYVADVLLGACAALRACHHVGIVHRDLKPANIFVADTETGFEVKVLDFGVSKAPRATELTVDGQILGTPHYLSPEQLMGTAGPESDQYALGVVLYVCLTKRLPYQDLRDFALLRAIGVGQFDPPSLHRRDLPEGLDAIVLRAMHVAPQERFRTVHELGQELWRFASAGGKNEWRNLFLETPPPLRPPNQSTRGIAMIEALAARPPGAPSSSPAVMGGVVVRTPPSDDLAQPGTSDSGDRQRLLSTKLAPLSERPSDVTAGAQAKSPRRRLAGVSLALGVLAVAAGGIALWRRPPVAEKDVPLPTVGDRAAGSTGMVSPSLPRVDRAPTSSTRARGETEARNVETNPGQRPRARGAHKRPAGGPAVRAAGPPASTDVPAAAAPTDAPPSRYPAVGLSGDSKYPAVR